MLLFELANFICALRSSTFLQNKILPRVHILFMSNLCSTCRQFASFCSVPLAQRTIPAVAVQERRIFDPAEEEIPEELFNMNFMAKKAWLAKNYDLPHSPFGLVRGKSMKEYLVNQREINFRVRDSPLSYTGMILDQAVQPPIRPVEADSFMKFNLQRESYLYVDDGAKFVTMMRHLDTQKELYVDVERNNFNCYQKEAVMLIQISTVSGTETHNYLIDPLAVTEYIRYNLKRIFEKPSIYKIFHDYRGDVVSLLAQFDIYTTGIVDSTVLHQKLFPEDYEVHEITGNTMWQKRGLADLVYEYLGHENQESFKYYSSLKELLKPANWAIRPIQNSMRHYAVGDSLLLLKVVNEWKKKVQPNVFISAWKNVHDGINDELTRPGSKVTFTPIQDPQFSATKIIQLMNNKKAALRRRRKQFTDLPITENNINRILEHRLYLAKVMDERPETILRTNDLVDILIYRPETEEEIQSLLCQHAMNYPCTEYWSTIILRFFEQGEQVFDDMKNVQCHKCDGYGHPARFCYTFVERGRLFYDRNPEYNRIHTNLRNTKNQVNAKFRQVFQKIQDEYKNMDLINSIHYRTVEEKRESFEQFKSDFD